MEFAFEAQRFVGISSVKSLRACSFVSHPQKRNIYPSTLKIIKIGNALKMQLGKAAIIRCRESGF